MRRVCVVALVFLLSGCGQPSATSARPGPASTASASAGASSPARPSASPSASTGLPAGTIDVSAYPNADFASPDGKVRCSLTAQDATCDFPDGMKRTGVPSAAKVCPGAPLKVEGVTVSGLVEYFCSRGDDAHPQQKGSAAVWARTAGVPTVTVGKEKLVTLPDGRTLAHGTLSCTSAGAAVTCTQSQTGASFTISGDGVKISSGK